MKYLKVLPQGELTSEQRAERISYELWAISRPPAVRNPNDVTSYMFGWIKHPSKDPAYSDIVDTALMIDPNYTINVHPQNNLDNLAGLFPELDQTQKESLVNWIQSHNNFVFSQIIPSEFTIFDSDQMRTSGWVQESESE